MLGSVCCASLALVAAIGSAVVYWIGAREVISGSMTVGTMVALAAYVTRIYQPLTSLTNARLDVLLTLVSFERVFELLDTPTLIEDAPDAVPLTSPGGEIVIDDVWFQYPAASDVSLSSLEGEGVAGLALDPRPSDFVLRGVSASIAPRQLVALVGPSGAGQTTLSQLLPRLDEGTRGAIRVDVH